MKSDEEKVDKDVMDWVTARRKTQPRTQEPRQEEEVKKNRQMVVIFVNVHGLKEFLMDVSLSDKVSDFVRRILHSASYSRQDTYVTCVGRVLRWSDELKSARVGDGCTVQIMNMMRGGGKHRKKKNKAEKKPAASPKN